MKKHVIIATSAALLSTSAFATKSRMTALGQDEDRGSQYLNDTRNKFRNAAHVNNMNNYVVTEWGANATAEGGMFRDSGNFAYGLYFNDQNNNVERTGVDAGTGTVDFEDQTNRLDLFFGGDAGVQWGARVHYASSENEANSTENSTMGLGFGVLMGDLSAYANLDLSDESEGSFNAAGGATADAADKFEADLGLNLGVAYDWNNWTFHADYDKKGDETTIGGTKSESEDTTITVGAAQVHEISSTSMVFTALDYMNMKDDNAGSETKTNNVKATVGFEADATSWLTWRGSISQNVIMGTEEQPSGEKDTQRDSTNVNAGASLTFGKLMVDGTIGASGGKSGALRLDEAFTNVAVSYWF
jgi:hypothetical protein